MILRLSVAFTCRERDVDHVTDIQLTIMHAATSVDRTLAY